MKQILLLTAFVLAGCAEPAAEHIPVQEVARDPDIFGLVVDENGTLLPNVTLTAYPDEIVYETNVTGAFEIFNVSKQVPIQLEARKEGYRNSTALLRLDEGFAAQVVFTMPHLSSLPPQFLVQEFEGYLACKSEPPLPCPLASEDRFARFQSQAPQSDLTLKETVVELFFESSSTSSGKLRIQISNEEQVLLDESVENGWSLRLQDPETTYNFEFFPGGKPTDLIINQQFDLYVTHFYNKPAPTGYSIAS